MSEVVRVAMWSGPRNISTAMMRAFENRPDTVVVDEPLYAAYLARTGVDHPAREEVLATQPTSLQDAIAGLQAPLPSGRRVHYAKHMAHHLPPETGLGWTLRFRNALLIRDPSEVVASYVRARETCAAEDIGLLQQGSLLEFWDTQGAEVPILDAADFLRGPEAHLRWLCDWLGIPFTPRMLSWPSGPRDSDGVWAPHWYAAVWASTGFEPWRPRETNLSDHDAEVAEACRPTYEALYARRVRLRRPGSSH
jgi:sulfotransferase family protein